VCFCEFLRDWFVGFFSAHLAEKARHLLLGVAPMMWIAIGYLACFAVFVECLARAPELPWHD